MNKKSILGIPILIGVIALIAWAFWPTGTDAGSKFTAKVQPLEAVNVDSVKVVNLYVDFSGSMRGYVDFAGIESGKNTFISTISSMLDNIESEYKLVSVSKCGDRKYSKDPLRLAMQNKNFRLALTTSLDRGAYNATTVGDDLKFASLVNSYTPGNFVFLKEDVTVQINGTDKTYAAGTWYGQIMQDQLDADGIKVKVWDPTADGGVGASFGYDGWYNVDYCRELLAKAVEELKTLGVEITKENPLKLEIPYYDISDIYSNRAAALEQSIEASTEGLVDIVTVKCGGEDAYNWYYATYFPVAGDDMNFNLMDNSGWGPDYGDPQTYLDTMFLGGYMLKCIGLY